MRASRFQDFKLRPTGESACCRPTFREVQARKDLLKRFRVGGTCFEALAFRYNWHPSDGHDLDQLVPVLAHVKATRDGPMLSPSCITKERRRSYAPLKAERDRGIASAKFDVLDRRTEKITVKRAAYHLCSFARALSDEASGATDRICGA